MPIRPRISTLPASIRRQLDRKLKASGFGNLVAIAAWLESKGYAIGKSAVGVYSKRLKADMEARAAAAQRAQQLAQQQAAEQGAAELRLVCLQAAARSPGSTSAVLKRAEAFAAWVRTGHPPKGTR